MAISLDGGPLAARVAVLFTGKGDAFSNIPIETLRRMIVYVGRYAGWSLSDLMDLEVDELKAWNDATSALIQAENDANKIEK